MRDLEQVDGTECLEDDLPKTQRVCNSSPCPTLAPAVWVTGDWSQVIILCFKNFILSLSNGDFSQKETRPLPLKLAQISFWSIFNRSLKPWYFSSPPFLADFRTT